MKTYKWLTLCLTLGLLAMLAGCGEKTSSEVSVSTTPETFGDMSTVERAQESATAQPASTAQADTQTDASAASSASEPSEPQDLTLLAVKSAVYCDYLDHLTYDATDPVYYWRAMGYLIGQVGEQDPNVTVTDGTVELNTTDLPPFENALFGDTAAECPSVTEEDPVVAQEASTICSSGATLDTYRVTERDFSALEVTMTDPADQNDGTYTSEVTLTDGDTVAHYTVTLRDSTYVVEQTKLFSYSIAGIEAN